MVLPKLKWVLPAVAAAALLIAWLTPHYSEEDKRWYVSVFCAVPHADERRLITAMENVVEGGNSDYALQKIHFNAGLAKHIVGVWQGLTPAQKQQVEQNTDSCKQLINAQIQP
ncbi:hypothetical protein [Pantoea sp. 1.19]|uniref:hypothetical protein n=1 Tax=Pantoea sp. 1.19 TaxID=1925589 RepID=UPI000948B92A|nr:hypothetical protein [Pantoea sp. 1.19]